MGYTGAACSSALAAITAVRHAEGFRLAPLPREQVGERKPAVEDQQPERVAQPSKARPRPSFRPAGELQVQGGGS